MSNVCKKCFAQGSTCNQCRRDAEYLREQEEHQDALAAYRREGELERLIRSRKSYDAWQVVGKCYTYVVRAQKRIERADGATERGRAEYELQMAERKLADARAAAMADPC